MADTPVVLITGARQTGRTTLVQELAADSGARYFTLDDSATLALAAGDPSGFIRNLTRPVAIDEIQKAPDLLPAIKLSVDQDRRPGRFLLTGSANVMTVPRVSESLAGRMEIIPLYPFSAGELAGHTEGFLHRLFAGSVDFPELAFDVVGELRKQASWTNPRTVLFHLRTSTGSEVDVVLENPDGSIVAIEVKWSPRSG